MAARDSIEIDEVFGDPFSVFTPDLLDAIELIAGHYEVTMSQWIRGALQMAVSTEAALHPDILGIEASTMQ